MRPGTKKILGNEYKNFKRAMIDAAESGGLPVGLQHADPSKLTLSDLRDLYLDFKNDTGLVITGHTFLCPDCDRIHLLLEVDSELTIATFQ